MSNTILNHGTTSSILTQMIFGTILAVAGAAVSWVDHAEQFLRMGASCVAIVSGCVVIMVAMRKKPAKIKIEKDDDE